MGAVHRHGAYRAAVTSDGYEIVPAGSATQTRSGQGNLELLSPPPQRRRQSGRYRRVENPGREGSSERGRNKEGIGLAGPEGLFAGRATFGEADFSVEFKEASRDEAIS